MDSSIVPPPLAIRAVLSRDDSDGETSVLSDSVPLDEIGSKGFSSTNSSSFGSDSEKEEEEEEGGQAPPEISNPIVQIPIAKITADEDEDEELVIGEEDDDDRFVVGGNSIAVKNVTPKVRASGNEEFEFEEEEGFETASEDDKDDDVFVDYDSDEDDVEDESSSEDFEGPQMNSMVEEPADSAGEAVSKVNEDLDDTQVSETEDFASANTEDVITDDLKVLASVDQAPERSQEMEVPVSADSGNGQMDANVNSIGLNRSEVEDTVAEMVQSKDSVTESFAVEETISGVSKDLGDSDAKLTNVGADDNQIPFALEIPEHDGAKFSYQEDSVVDKVNLDEAIRTGAAVVGEHDALKDVEAKENDSAVGKSIKTELGSSSHDTDHVDDVAAPEATFDGSMSNADGVLGRDEEIVQLAEIAEDTNNSGLDNLHLNESTEEVKDDQNEESLDDTQVSETKDFETSVDEEIASANSEDVITDDLKVLSSVDQAAERSREIEIPVFAHSGNGEMDANVDSIGVNRSEVGDNVTEMVQSKDSMTETCAVEEPVSGVSNDNQIPFTPEIPDLAQSGNCENDGAKFSNQEDSVVDKVNVDLVEAIRTGKDVVGEHDALKGVEAKENDSAVGKSIKTGIKPAVLGSSSHDTDHVDDVAAPEAEIDGSMSRDRETVQKAEISEDTNDSGLDNLCLNESTEEVKNGHKTEEDEESLQGSIDDDETDGLIFGGTAAARQFIQEMEQASERIDGQIVTDSEEEADSDIEQDGSKLFDPTAFAALLKAATSTNMDSSNPTVTSEDVTHLFTVDRPAGLGPTFHHLRPPGRPIPGATSVAEEKLTEEERNKLDKLQQLRVKFIRLIYRLGHPVEDSVAARVLYQLALVAGRSSIPYFSLKEAKQTALKLEEEKMDDLNFSLNILVLGKSGVGKSATINSIFGEEKVRINAFEPGTKTVNEITGVVNGVNIRVIDTPGLRSSALDHSFNNKVLSSVKKLTKKLQPDIVLYVDRLDSRAKDLNDLPMLRKITSSLGPSIWRNAIVALTHAACAPPDGPSGSPLGYDMYVAQRSHVVQQCIRQAVGDFRLLGSGLMNPVSLVENQGQKILLNGQTWIPQLMLLCFSTKILSEASSISDEQRLFGLRGRSIPLPYLLSSLLQPRAHPKLGSDQGGDDVDSDIEYSDLEVEEEEDEYDQLPPFKPLSKGQISSLSKEQKKAYLDEFDYRVKLLQKKQWKEELKRMKLIKNKGTPDASDYDQENEAAAAPSPVPVPLPDMALPQTFDSDNPTYRYRFLEPSSQFQARPVLDSHSWDHDCGYDSVNIDQHLGIADRFPAALTVQVTKDKKDFNLHLDSSIAAKHGENSASMFGLDIQNIGKQLGYIVRGETKYKKLAGGGSVTFLGGNVATGLKLEDQVSVGKRLVLVGSTGTVRSNEDAAYGANIDIRLRDADHPIGQDQSSVLLSLMKWKGDFAVGANLQSRVSVGRNTKMDVRVAVNNKLSGQIMVKTSSSDNLQLALVSLVPIAVSVFRSIRPGASQEYDVY